MPPVFVMLPLDTVKIVRGGVDKKEAMSVNLMALKSVQVEGVMVDVWWGLVEKKKPGEYNWAGYEELMDMCAGIGLKVQAVMSFHQCGGNVGDSYNIPLPSWVLEETQRDPDLAYTDQEGRRNREYISLGCDTLPVLKGRTPIQCYTDFMLAFQNHFKRFLSSTIVEIQVGMGPTGELRYPSYPELNHTWRFPGIGAFQCYDKYMKAALKAAAGSAQKPERGHGGPTDAGSYNSRPEDVLFFRNDGGWDTDYGRFFLGWYSGMLLSHCDRVLHAAASVFGGDPVRLSVKVAGVHWHHGTRSHAAELTAGYYDTVLRDGYVPVARMIGRYGATLNFTCMEMRDREHPEEALCRPEGLVRKVAEAAREVGVSLAGENALPRYDGMAYDKIVETAMRESMCSFMYLRMSEELFWEENWRGFVGFVDRMRG